MHDRLDQKGQGPVGEPPHTPNHELQSQVPSWASDFRHRLVQCSGLCCCGRDPPAKRHWPLVVKRLVRRQLDDFKALLTAESRHLLTLGRS